MLYEYLNYSIQHLVLQLFINRVMYVAKRHHIFSIRKRFQTWILLLILTKQNFCFVYLFVSDKSSVFVSFTKFCFFVEKFNLPSYACSWSLLSQSNGFFSLETLCHCVKIFRQVCLWLCWQLFLWSDVSHS